MSAAGARSRSQRQSATPGRLIDVRRAGCLTHGVNTGKVAWEDGHPPWRGETDVEAALASLVGRK
jgi:hypothetical protein